MRNRLVDWIEDRETFVFVKFNSLNRLRLRRKMLLIALRGCVHRHAISNPESSSLARLGSCSGVLFVPFHLNTTPLCSTTMQSQDEFALLAHMDAMPPRFM